MYVLFFLHSLYIYLYTYRMFFLNSECDGLMIIMREVCFKSHNSATVIIKPSGFNLLVLIYIIYIYIYIYTYTYILFIKV